MGKRITIKDIAQKAGISLGAAHNALSGKSGVGDETRKRVLEIAREYHYKPNKAAAALKRGTVRLAIVMPEAAGENRFYIRHYWRGVEDYLHSVEDYNIEVVEVPFSLEKPLRTQHLNDKLRQLHTGESLQGAIFAADYMETENVPFIRKIWEDGAELVFIGDRLEGLRPLCCIQPDYRIVGRVAAELLTREIGGRDILLCAGSSDYHSHRETVKGFEDYLSENDCGNQVRKCYSDQGSAQLKEQIENRLKENDNLGACFAVTARTSVILGKALAKIKDGASLAAIGSDMFEENITCLKEGIFSNLVNKNPYTQAYTAAKILADYLLQDMNPKRPVIYTGSELVFKSSLPLYAEVSETPAM